MFFIFSKLLNFLANPLIYLLVLLVIAVYIRNSKFKKIIAGIAGIYFLIFTNPVLYHTVNQAWCKQEIAAWPTRHYIYCFIPGGMTGYDWVRNEIDYNQAVDRIITAVRLYKEQKIDTILISGDTGSSQNETLYRQHLEKVFGIPGEILKVEKKATTTWENFKFSKPMMIQGNILVVNSARYMKRSKLCAHRLNIIADYYACDAQASPFNSKKWLSWWPELSLFGKWQQLGHEWLGLIVYQIK